MNESFLNLHDAVQLLTSLECIVLAIIIKNLSRKRPQPRLILAVFFLIVAVDLASTVLVWNGELQSAPINHTPFVVAIMAASIQLQGPILFFYLRALSEKIVVLRWVNLVHLLPALATVVTIVAFNITSTDWHHSSSVIGVKKIALDIVWALIKLTPFIYVLASVLAEYNLRKQAKQIQTDFPLSELKLADVVLLGFCLHWLWAVVSYSLESFVPQSVSDTLGILNNYLTVILVNGLFIFGLINTRQLLSFNPDAAPKKATPKPTVPLPDPKIKAIESGIHEQKLHLEATMNLERFSERIGLRPRQTSAVLRSHYNSSFQEFINQHRIEEARVLLASPKYRYSSITEVIFASGFNSTSAFHRFFKRNVGVTPTQFRKKLDS